MVMTVRSAVQGATETDVTERIVVEEIAVVTENTAVMTVETTVEMTVVTTVEEKAEVKAEEKAVASVRTVHTTSAPANTARVASVDAAATRTGNEPQDDP